MENWPKLTNSPTIQHFQHILMETTPFLGIRRCTMTVVYDPNCKYQKSIMSGLVQIKGFLCLYSREEGRPSRPRLTNQCFCFKFQLIVDWRVDNFNPMFPETDLYHLWCNTHFVNSTKHKTWRATLLTLGSNRSLYLGQVSYRLVQNCGP